MPAALKPWEGADTLQLWDTGGSVLSMVEHPTSSTLCPSHGLVLQQCWSCAFQAELQHSTVAMPIKWAAGMLNCQTRRAAMLPTHARLPQGADFPHRLLQHHHRA